MKFSRDWAVPLLVGVLLVGFYALQKRPPARPAPGAIPVSDVIPIQAAPPVDNPPGGGWSRYDVSLPADVGPLECRLYTIRDGRGDGHASWGPLPVEAAPTRMSFRLNRDLDAGVKTILQAQSLPTKPNVVTYTYDFFCGPAGFPGNPITLRFAHGSSGAAEAAALPATGTYRLGQKIPLLDVVFTDDAFHESGNGSLLGFPNDAAFASHFPPGAAHRLTFQVMFAARR